MTYRITQSIKSNGTWKGFFSEYLVNIPFSTIQAKFPAMTESDWETAKAEILDYVNNRQLIAGVTSYTSTPNSDGNGSTQVWEWADEQSYLVWTQDSKHTTMMEKYGIISTLRHRGEVSLKGDFAPAIDDPDIKLGTFVTGLYAIENDSLLSITDETI